MNFYKENLIPWFLEEKREFPWRKEHAPYRVWVSEVMLQQTRASVVVPYFEKWMTHFPTVEALAMASLEEVMKIWEGLGYYSRARQLHQTAKVIVSRYGGVFPETQEELKGLKGIGPYTAGAILSFAFHKKAAAIDGNVMRVISRLFCIEESIEKKTTQEKIYAKVMFLLSQVEEAPWIAMEALIELGALVCGKIPLCDICPLEKECRARELGKERELPVKKKRKEVIRLERAVFIICYQEEVLIRQEEVHKLMGGLYEFPYLEKETEVTAFYPEPIERIKSLQMQKQFFTHYAAALFPSIWQALVQIDIKGYQWVKIKELPSLPFSSGHRKILHNWLY